MRACGICGSDLMDWYQAPRAPVVLGHEPVGEDDVAVAEPLPERRAIAERIGAVAVEPAPAAIPFRPDVVVVCVSAPEAFELAVTAVDEGGVVQLFAPPSPETRLPLDGTT